MVQKPTRLRFTEDELADSQVKKAADRADKAVDKAEKAVDKLSSKKKKTKLRMETDAANARKAKLRFDKTVIEDVSERPSRAKQLATRSAAVTVTSKAHQAVSQYEDDNVGVQSTQEITKAVESTAYTVDHAVYSRKLKAYDKAEKLVQKSDKANVNALYEKFKKDNPDAGSNPFSRWRQKQAIKKEYAAAKAGKSTATSSATKGAEKATEKVAQGAKNITEKAAEYITTHSKMIWIVLVVGLLFMVISGMFTSCGAMFQGGTQVLLGTSYTAEDEDIIGAEQYYRKMEADLRKEIQEMQEEDYDEFRLNVDEIGHNPWQLASLLTVLYEDYTVNEVKGFLRQVFNAQYSLSSSTSTETVTETKTVRVGESLGTVTTSGYCNCVICCGQWSGGPTASGVYPTANHTIAVDANNPFVPMGTKVVMNGVEYTVEDTGNFARYGVQFDVYYDSHIAATFHGHKQWECYLADSNGSNSVEVTTTETKRILTITATNHTLTSVIANMNLTADQRERYEVLLETKGNRPYLFEDDIYSNAGGEYTDYDIPGEALTDTRFARMIREAEKYLGYPYVWGGSSPSTSFDCSGFVSWVINNCGNGWSVGRQTANGLMGVCDIIPKSQAKPGDLIFFQGTYDTAGASHVGIYVGNGMMIHCGNPISYASIETSYWQQHFYCFGRIRN